MKSSKTLSEFTEYCKANPELRFWQALRAFMKVDAIITVGIPDSYTNRRSLSSVIGIMQNALPEEEIHDTFYDE